MNDETDGVIESPDATVPDADGTLLAIRRLGAELVSDEVFQRLFPAEVNALRGLDEPWLAQPTSYLLDSAGRIVAALRRDVPGLRFSAFLEDHPRGLDAQTTTVIAIDVLAALSALHARGVGHGAVAAENVIIDTEGTCVLVDVGLVPRTGSQTIESVVTTDLTWFADLVALSLAGRPVGRRRRQAPLLMGAWLPKTVPEPVRSLLRRTLDPARGAASAADAAVALADLSVSAVQLYDADWDVRARERLANASRAAMGTASATTSAATSLTAPLAATPGTTAETEAEPEIRVTPARQPTRHRRQLTRCRVGRRVRLASVAFGLLAACVAIGLILALTGSTGGPPAMTQVMTYMTPSASASARHASPPATVPGTPTPTITPTAPATPTTSTGTNTLGSTSPSVPATSQSSAPVGAPSASSQPPEPPPTSPPSNAPGDTAVTRLSIIEFSYAHLLPLEAVVVIDVRTSGTGPVTLTLTFAGSNRSGMPGSNFQLSVSDTLRDHRAYVVAYRVLDIDYCFTDFWGIDVTTSPPGPASAYAQLPALPCWGPIAKRTGKADLDNVAAHRHTARRRVSGNNQSRVLPIGRFGGG
ncbi:protein kinase [Actinocrinis sp.]|uniref:protein kinase n=1 Tax=Actinocrinis sp. TaxID=1920516 RepID=UPI002DDD11AD|nr:protein kinase [Actinocrinis sp.]